MKTTSKYTLSELSQLPNQAGVYHFYNKEEKIIYIGKAKNLKKRVKSYFNKNHDANMKTRRMVAEIAFVRFTIVNTESEALLLENNLIKSYQPRYNILLKDGKSYPYLCITNECFPKVIMTRQTSPNLGKYYGPFTSLKHMYQMLELIKQLFNLRTCHYNLSAENIQKKKFKVCLDYHIGHCKGPCEGLQSITDYNQDINQVAELLKGNLSVVKRTLKERMLQAAEERNYKWAHDFKVKLEMLEAYQSKSLITNPNLGDLDVLSVISDHEQLFVSYLQVKEGAIIFTQTITAKKQLEEPDEELIPLLVTYFRQKYHSCAQEILINSATTVPIHLENLTFTIPKIGDKKKLVDLATKNALFLQKEMQLKKEANQEREESTLKLLQEAFHIKELPLHIECFDNSNIQGAHPVAAMVVFKKGKPAKKEYRHYNIKTVLGPDDYASMREVVGRRYKKLQEECKPLPQLIVIDGGKGQLSAAVDALKTVGVYGKLAIIGIAKRLEEIYFPEDSHPLLLSKKSPVLKLIQHIRNEAHRFAITFHRQKRSQNSFKSILEAIHGVGPETIKVLLQHFKSVTNIKKASLAELATLIGTKKAEKVKEELLSADASSEQVNDNVLSTSPPS